MNRQHLVLAGVALFSLALGAVTYHLLQTGVERDSQPGASATIELHSIPLTDLDGRETVFGDWRGDLLIVNFWAPWCAPCRREIPALIEIQQEFAARGVRIIGLAFDGEQPVRRFAAEYAINYPLFLVAERAPMYIAAFGNTSGSLPFTALLDRELKPRFRHTGELSAQQLRSEIEKLL